MSFQKIKPTQPELDQLKKKRTFSLKGESLLEIKKEQLFSMLKKTLVEYFALSKKIRTDILEKYDLVEKILQLEGKSKIKMIGALNQKMISPEVDITFINKLGIDIPKITLNMGTDFLPNYGFSDTAFHLDYLMASMPPVLESIIKLAELDNQLHHLSNNYRKIQRRINALDDFIIPNLNNNIRIIEDILQDSEREEFIRLKKIKESLEKQHKE